MGILLYYLATSIDGYLARKDGSVDWLSPFQTKLSTPYDYEAFYKTVSSVMGRKTWEVAKSFEKEPYAPKKSFIVSKSLREGDLPSYCSLVRSLEKEWIEQTKKTFEGRIWLVGGAIVASKLIQMRLLDEIVQTIVPVTIGQWIQWIGSHEVDLSWKLVECHKAEMGIVQLVYRSH